MTPEREAHLRTLADGRRRIKQDGMSVTDVEQGIIDLIDELDATRKDRDGWKIYGQAAGKHADEWREESFTLLKALEAAQNDRAALLWADEQRRRSES